MLPFCLSYYLSVQRGLTCIIIYQILIVNYHKFMLTTIIIDIISMKTPILLLICVVLASCSVRPDKPVNIPEVSNVYDKPWYSGYLDIPFENFKAHMHYFYFPSQSASADKDPVLFWFNGGPGCSSLLGALYEHGPFIFNDAFGSLVSNPDAWNKRAHTIYIQSPAQVGFSYMDLQKNQSYPTWNDNRTATLNLRAVLQFFKVFPEFQNRPTYLSGESYAGIYVPTLAYKIHEYNRQYPNSINLQGFAVGNGCTDLTECEFINDYPRYQYRLFNDLGILPDSDFEEANKLCDTPEEQLPKPCQDKMDEIDNMTQGINIYDAYRPCWENSADLTKFTDKLKQFLRTKKIDERVNGWAPPCVDSEGIDKLLDNPNNRKLMGIPDHVPSYDMCTIHNFSYDRSKTGSYWVYKQLIPLNQYKIIKYSGDSDPAVPFSGTLLWVNKIRKQLKLSTIEYWKPWTVKITNGAQNSGSIWKFSKRFTLFRFKGVGHMAPQWNNKGGTKLINYLLFDEEP